MNDMLQARIMEEQNLFIGNDVMFSLGIWIRTSDAHLIYSADSMERVNISKSVFIGDHVWVGQDVILLKGSQIASGSIIGAKAVVSGQTIPSNTVWAGNPIKLISNNKFWLRSIEENDKSISVSHFTTKEKKLYQKWASDDFIFKSDPKVYLPFDKIETHLRKCGTANKRLIYLQKLSSIDAKNRFAF